MSYTPEHTTASLKTKTLANPAAGTATVSFTVPAGVSWKVLGMFARYTASSVATTRRDISYSVADSSGNVWFRSSANAMHFASEVKDYSVSPGVNHHERVAEASSESTLLATSSEHVLDAGSVVSLTVAGGDTGDQWSLIALRIVEFA